MTNSNLLHFTKVRFKNFLSSGAGFIEVGLDSYPSTLIVGRNGHGKSTLIEAIIFALYGKPFRSIKMGQLVNRVNRKDCVVEIEFSRGGNHYRVVRGLAPSKFEIYCNGELRKREAKTADYQSGFEKDVLRISHKSFCQAVVLGTASYTPFMKLPTPERRKFIEDLLDLDIFTKMNVLLKARVSENKAEIKDAQHEVSMAENSVRLLDQQRAQAEEAETKSQEVLDRRKEALTIQMEDIKKKIDDLKTEMQGIEVPSEESRQALTADIAKINGFISKVGYQKETLEKEIAFYAKHADCPTCRQYIDDSVRRDKQEDGAAEIVRLDAMLRGLHESLEERQAVVADNNKTLSTVNSLSISGRQYVGELKALKSAIQQVDADKDVVVVRFDYAQLNAMKQTLRDSKDKLNRLMKQAELHAAGAKLLADTGIKSKIIAKFIPELNELVNGYLGKMDMFVGFDLDEDFNETIKARYLEETSYDSFSQGEKMRIDLALLFAWRAVGRKRNTTNTNLFMMDEILDGALDDNGTQEALQIIHNLSSDRNSFIVSHKEDKVSDFFSRVIRVSKVDGFTEMAEEVVSGSMSSSEPEI